jgi:hypothetical protein
MAKNILLLVAMALIGVVAGYALCYFIYQPQITSMNAELEEAQTKINTLNATIQTLDISMLKRELDIAKAQIEELNSTLQALLKSLPTNNILSSEELEFKEVYVTSTSASFYIVLKLRNIGSLTLTINDIYINGAPWSDLYAAGKVFYQNLIGLSLGPNESFDDGRIQLVKDYWTSGMTIELLIITSSGRTYSVNVTLP